MSEHMTASLHEINEHWSMDDLLAAHVFLDVQEEAERLAAEKR